MRRRARAERDEQDALHWDALSKAMREHQEECRRLELRLKSAEQVEQAEQVARVETEENEGNEGHEGQPRATKKAEEVGPLDLGPSTFFAGGISGEACGSTEGASAGASAPG